ncbi:MAG: CBS domain-containing protein [Candidatus Acidiferrales bacterium]
MRVLEVMTGKPAFCTWDTNLGAAVELLWNQNCGILPIVDAEQRVVGVVTDRDVCIALGTRNRLPGEITVGEVASGVAFTCKVEDDVRVAMQTMAREYVRRLPVVGKDGKLAGILSMDDIVLHADDRMLGRTPEISSEHVVETLKKLYRPQASQLAMSQRVTA